MKYFDKIIKELLKEAKDMELGQILQEARERCGIFQYRVADYLGISADRLKRLETGRFSDELSKIEIDNICNFYEFPRDFIIKKSKENYKKNCKNKARRYFSHETMQCVQKKQRK